MILDSQVKRMCVNKFLELNFSFVFVNKRKFCLSVDRFCFSADGSIYDVYMFPLKT